VILRGDRFGRPSRDTFQEIDSRSLTPPIFSTSAGLICLSDERHTIIGESLHDLTPNSSFGIVKTVQTAMTQLKVSWGIVKTM